MSMLDRAVSSGASIEVLEKLMGLQERYEANQARKSFDNAMAAAKVDIPTIAKNREVDFTSQKGRTHALSVRGLGRDRQDSQPDPGGTWPFLSFPHNIRRQRAGDRYLYCITPRRTFRGKHALRGS